MTVDSGEEKQWLKEENVSLKRKIRALEQAETARQQELEACQKSLKVNLVRYNDLIDNSRSIILEWDAEGNILFINNWGLELFGFTKEELIGHNVVGTIVPPKDKTGYNLIEKMQAIQKAPDEFYSHENENIRKNGKSVWINWTNRGILDRDGILIKTLSVGIDRTQQHQLETALAQYNTRLEREVEERTLELREIVMARTREIEEIRQLSEALRRSAENFR
jgi:PAS domain S-box-containing protein